MLYHALVIREEKVDIENWVYTRAHRLAVSSYVWCPAKVMVWVMEAYVQEISIPYVSYLFPERV